MGLILLELMCEVEEKFGIEIPDEDQERIMTPGKLIDYIAAKLPPATHERCLSLWAFNRIRKACVSTGLVTRRDLTLDLPFAEWIPRDQRKEIWPQLVSVSQFPCWPGLTFPPWAVVLMWTMAIGFAIMLGLAVPVGTCNSVFTGTLGALFLILTLQWIMRGFQTSIPARARTPRSLIECFLEGASASVLESGKGPTREQIAQIVRSLTIEMLGLPEENYREDADYIKDLGAD